MISNRPSLQKRGCSQLIVELLELDAIFLRNGCTCVLSFLLSSHIYFFQSSSIIAYISTLPYKNLARVKDISDLTRLSAAFFFQKQIFLQF